MKKSLIAAAAFAMTFVSYSWAAETADVHSQVNNAQAPAHQMMSSAKKHMVEGADSTMMNMDQHQQAMVAHETMNNGHAPAHQQMVDMHKKMMEKPAAN